jgi:Na+:H+ antiporter, NhaA family
MHASPAHDEALPPSPSTPIERLLLPFETFLHAETSGGIVLFACSILALLWANSPWVGAYEALWQVRLVAGAGDIVIDKPLLLWINDGLMAVFFFVVGLEIKRELLYGDLGSPRQAALPIAAAVGGMLVPALLYFALNAGKPGATGWGIPMATDIAFALGVLALLGSRAPLALKVFLTALAIVDDLGAVLVIAIFYTAHIKWTALAIGLVLIALLVLLSNLGVRRVLPYALIGIVVWVAFLKSGVHATIAGVLLAMTIPARVRIKPDRFLLKGRRYIDLFAHATSAAEEMRLNRRQQTALRALEKASEKVQSPAERLEHALHPWVVFVVMPVFALSNAGVTLGGDLVAGLTHPVTLGIILGLVAGKQLGIMLFAWLAVRLGIASLPAELSWRHVYGAAWLAGIGFTMSLFVAGLAFGGGTLEPTAKLGILAASLISGAGGWLVLSSIRPVAAPPVPAAPAA